MHLGRKRRFFYEDEHDSRFSIALKNLDHFIIILIANFMEAVADDHDDVFLVWIEALIIQERNQRIRIADVDRRREFHFSG